MLFRSHGIRFGIKNPEILKAELKAMKRVAQNGKKIGILIPQVISVEELKKVKQFLKEIEFNDAKVGIMIETPAAVQLIQDFFKEKIDFISFGLLPVITAIRALFIPLWPTNKTVSFRC